MAACSDCHQQIPEISEGKFCPFCGAAIAPEPAAAQLPSDSSEPSRVGETGPDGSETRPARRELAEPARRETSASSVEPLAEPARRETSASSVEPLAEPAQTPAMETGQRQDYVPWEDQKRLGFLPALSQTWSEATFRPTAFFSQAPKTGNFGAALLYAFLLGTTASMLSLFWNYLFWDSWWNAWSDLRNFEGFLIDGVGREFLGVVALLIPFFTVVSLFIMSFIYHVCLLITGSGRYGWETTFRGLCYSYGPQLFTLIPGCGSLIAVVWQYVLMVIGWREMHESTTGRVLLAVFLPFILCCGALIFLFWSLAGLIPQLQAGVAGLQP
jgi:hypothetical protein